MAAERKSGVDPADGPGIWPLHEEMLQSSGSGGPIALHLFEVLPRPRARSQDVDLLDQPRESPLPGRATRHVPHRRHGGGAPRTGAAGSVSTQPGIAGLGFFASRAPDLPRRSCPGHGAFPPRPPNRTNHVLRRRTDHSRSFPIGFTPSPQAHVPLDKAAPIPFADLCCIIPRKARHVRTGRVVRRHRRHTATPTATLLTATLDSGRHSRRTEP